ncbi:MAG: SRPBCC family protein [Chloroflexi bacterium]|nr:SRPBCC family protein [Chloroflexota bacterium]
MDIDFQGHLNAVERSVEYVEREGKAAAAVTLSRSFEASAEELWDAVSNAERIPRWFLPVSGDLKTGGRFQLEGNAGGEILACEPVSRFAATWEFGGDVSWVDVSVENLEGSARLTLTHTALLSPHWDEYGAGATGVGWEMGLMGLAIHLEHPDAPLPEEDAFTDTPEGKAFIADCSAAWAAASVSAGTDREAAYAAGRSTTAFYTGESESAE